MLDMTQRREFLNLMAGTALTMAASTPARTSARAAARSAGDATAAEPVDVGRKFYADGRVHPFRGNTIICRLDQQGERSGPFNALQDIYRELPATRFFRKITVLPPSSYHMTIFGGANDPDRKPGLWPRDIALNTPIEECNRLLSERLKAATIGPVVPTRMRVDTSEPAIGERPLVIRLLPLDETENRKVRALRDRLSQILGIRAPGHDSYRFHISLAYLVQRLTAEELSAFRSAYVRYHADVARKCPVIEVGRPEFCVFDDMFAFHRQFYL